MRKAAALFGASLLFSIVARAEMPASTGAPTLEFRIIRLDVARSSERRVTPYRLFDKMIVTVWDPIVCGQQPVNPAFSIEGNILALNYSLSPAKTGEQTCTLISEFDISNMPRRDIEIHFADGSESYTLAKLTRCPGYTPKGENVYECLAPAAK